MHRAKGDRLVRRALPVGDNGCQYFQELADKFAKQKLVCYSNDSHMFFLLCIYLCLYSVVSWWHGLVCDYMACTRVKLGIYSPEQTAKFGQPHCLFHSSIIGIKIN